MEKLQVRHSAALRMARADDKKRRKQKHTRHIITPHVSISDYHIYHIATLKITADSFFFLLAEEGCNTDRWFVMQSQLVTKTCE